MVIIAIVGYIVNYFSAARFAGNTQISNTLGALAIGIMANLYSRVGGRLENWALDKWEDGIRPRIRPYWRSFRKQVFHVEPPKKRAKKLEDGTADDDESTFVRQKRRVGYGLAVASMLPAIFVQVPSGLAVNGSLISGLASANQIAGNSQNGTAVVNSTTLSAASNGNALNSIAFNVSYSVVQVAIGITVRVAPAIVTWFETYADFLSITLGGLVPLSDRGLSLRQEALWLI